MTRQIQLLRTRYLRGPNVWTYRPVLETWLDLGELEATPSDKLEGFNDRLVGWLPALVEHQCGVGERGGFIQRLREGTWLGHVLEHVVIELLNLAGMATGFGQTRSTSQRGVYRMVFRARDERVARVALEHGNQLVTAAINHTAFDVQASVTALKQVLDTWYFGPSTAAIVAAATDRRIPHVRLNEGNLVQFGYGARSRRIWTAETDATSAIAETIASDKSLTKQLIGSVGVPVPEGIVVDSANAAWEAAQELGMPVVIKPIDGNHGRGVALDLTNQADIHAAFDNALKHGSDVIVERCVPGLEHRLLVVGGKLVAAARGEAAFVVGDGLSTVRQLIDAQINSDPRRGDTERHPLGFIRPEDDEVIRADLTRQKLDAAAVPAAGRQVLIQRNGNVSVDCTDDVHPRVAQAVSLAARTVGLDIAGIDVVAQDISKPLQEQGGAVVEVNAGPGLLVHLKPASGSPRPVGQAIVDLLFGAEDNGRIPIVGISGTHGAQEVAHRVAWLLQLAGLRVGLACRTGVYVERRQLEPTDGTQWEAAQRVLINRSVDAAVFEHTARGLADDGLPYDRCKVGVVMDFEGWQGLGAHDITARDPMRKVLRTQVDVVLGDGAAVLNADEPGVAELAEHCDGDVVLYARDAHHPAVAPHIANGGRAVVLRGADVMVVSEALEHRLFSLPSGEPQGVTPLGIAPADAAQDAAKDTAQDAATLLAVAACGVALNYAPELIAASVSTYAPVV
jgi:cyanophycin synthetase